MKRIAFLIYTNHRWKALPNPAEPRHSVFKEVIEQKRITVTLRACRDNDGWDFEHEMFPEVKQAQRPEDSKP
jgi:hypothetical protein